MVGVTELARALDVDPSAAERLVLRDLELAAVEFVQDMTGRHFGASKTFTEIIDGRGRESLLLKEEPATITTVRERQNPGETWTAITDFELRGSRLLRTKGAVWQDGYEYEVVYPFGYAAGSEPKLIRQLVVGLVKWQFDRRSVEHGVESERVGPHAVSYATGAGLENAIDEIPWARETLERWEWPKVA